MGSYSHYIKQCSLKITFQWEWPPMTLGNALWIIYITSPFTSVFLETWCCTRLVTTRFMLLGTETKTVSWRCGGQMAKSLPWLQQTLQLTYRVLCDSKDHKTVFRVNFKEAEPCELSWMQAKVTERGQNRLFILCTSYIYMRTVSMSYKCQNHTSINTLNPDSILRLLLLLWFSELMAISSAHLSLFSKRNETYWNFSAQDSHSMMIWWLSFDSVKEMFCHFSEVLLEADW